AGLHLTPLDPAQLRVEQMQGQWTVRDPSRVLFSFGPQEADARTALSVLHKYGFTQVGTLGGAGPSMLVMLGRPEAGGEADANLPHLTHQPPLHPASPDDPNVPKAQAAKPPPHDANLSVAPIFPPLHDAAG